MCTKTDKVLVDAAWLIGGPSFVEWAGADAAVQQARCVESTADLVDGWISLDACLADEVLWLNGQGVKTFACCCGHVYDAEWHRYIAVEEYDYDSACLMRSLGYESRWLRVKGAVPEPFVFRPRW